MAKRMGRRDFLRGGAVLGCSAVLGWGARAGKKSGTFFSRGDSPDIAVAAGEDPHAASLKAVEVLGGMECFVPQGAKVAILPNSQSRHPGAFTKPEIVRAVIRMCRKAGAAEVHCLTWLGPEYWEPTGLAAAVAEEGGGMKFVGSEEVSFRPVPVPGGKVLREAMIMKEFYNHDVFIDMPITKDHAGNRFTGTMKNLMGLNFRSSNRRFHREDWKTNPESIQYLDQCIVDLNKVIQPTLCVVDATEFITTNGPFGPGKLARPGKVVAGVDRVAVDAYCASLWGLKAEEIAMIRLGAAQGLGEMDLEKKKIVEVEV